MANTKQALKRVRQAEKHRKQNVSQRTEMRTTIKKCLTAVAAGGKEVAVEAFKNAAVIVDRLSHRGLMHLNKASRIKSRLNKKLKTLN